MIHGMPVKLYFMKCSERCSENMLTHALLSLLFFSRGFIQIRFGNFDFFVFVFVL